MCRRGEWCAPWTLGAPPQEHGRGTGTYVFRGTCKLKGKVVPGICGGQQGCGGVSFRFGAEGQTSTRAGAVGAGRQNLRGFNNLREKKCCNKLKQQCFKSHRLHSCRGGLVIDVKGASAADLRRHTPQKLVHQHDQVPAIASELPGTLPGTAPSQRGQLTGRAIGVAGAGGSSQSSVGGGWQICTSLLLVAGSSEVPSYLGRYRVS